MRIRMLGCMPTSRGCCRGTMASRRFFFLLLNVTRCIDPHICRTRGILKTSLIRHQKTHNELPSLPCLIDGCAWSLNGLAPWFYRKDHVVEHLKTVHRFDKDTAKCTMGSRGASNPLLRGVNVFDDSLAAGPASTSGEVNGEQGQ